jgi:hypothetical protein
MPEEMTEDSAAPEEVIEQQEEFVEEQSPLTYEDDNESHTPSSVRDDIEQIEALARMDPSILEDPEYLAMKESLGQLEGEEQEEVDSEQQQEEQEEEQEEEEQEEVDDDDVFGLFKGEEEEEVDVNFDEDMMSHIKEKYSIDDPNKFLNSVDTWRNQAQEGTEYREKFDEIEEGLISLPGPIKSAISAFANGEDWNNAFGSTQSRLDYSDVFTSQDKEAVVQHYFGEKYEKLQDKLEDESIDEEDFAERYDELHEFSEKFFENDRKGFEKQRAKYTEEQDQIEEVRSGSIKSSVESLKKEYPNFSRADLQRVEQRMVDGNIEEPFYEKDGSYKAEAAEMMAFAMYGKRIMKALLNRATKDGTSSANETIVQRGNKKMRKASKNTSPEGKQNVDAVSHLNSHFDDDPYS